MTAIDDTGAGRRPLLHPIDDAERIPAKRYYDEAFYKLECEQLWPRVWQMACRIEQIPNIGDWIEYSNLDRSVIVVRTREGIKAYHNACRHRGVKLTRSGHGNCEAKGFTCPFHGWRWDMNGQNTFVYGEHLFSERQLEQADIALASCRVETALGCVFINWDDDAPSLRESLGPIVDKLEKYQAGKMRAEWCFASVLPANWKLAMEAFMEGLHVMRTHPQLQAADPAFYNSIYGDETGGIGRRIDPTASANEGVRSAFRHLELLSEGMAGMCHAKDVESARKLLDVEQPADPAAAIGTWFGLVNDQVMRDGRARGEPTPDLNALMVTDPVDAIDFLFPHFFLLPVLSSMSSYRIRPLGPESCLFEVWSLTLFPEGSEPSPVMEATMLPYDSKEYPAIPVQDYVNIPAQQLGLHSGKFEFMRLSKSVEGLISNYQRIIDGYLGGLPADALVAAQRLLGDNFSGPILDLGFQADAMRSDGAGCP